MCADLIRAESYALKDDLGCVKAQEFSNREVGNTLFGGGRVEVVSA